MKDNKQRGAITVEACVSVLVFIILMLLLSGLFVMFMAQNVTAHVTLQTSESLSVDAYRIERLMKEDGKLGTVGADFGQFITKLFGSSDDNPYFVTDNRWYNGKDEDVAQAVKTRFIGYLTGGDQSGKDATVKADEILRKLNIKDGLSGLDFSGSYVQNGTLYVVLKYNLEYDFNIWGLGTVEVEQKACSKLWK